MQTWIKILLALVVVALALAGAGLLYLYSGAYNIAATEPHTGAVRWILHTTQVRSVRAHAEDLSITLPADSAALARGYLAFKDMCAICHGAPGVEQGWMGQGLNPDPPDLSRVSEIYSPEELYWIVSNGIKMAGMPALSPTHNEEEILEIVAFIERLGEMSDVEYQALEARFNPAEQERAGEQTEGHGHAHDHTH